MSQDNLEKKRYGDLDNGTRFLQLFTEKTATSEEWVKTNGTYAECGKEIVKGPGIAVRLSDGALGEFKLDEVVAAVTAGGPGA